MAERNETLIIDATPEQNKETLDREQELIQIKKTLTTKYGTNLPDLTKVIASIADTKPPEQKPRIMAALLSLPDDIAKLKDLYTMLEDSDTYNIFSNNPEDIIISLTAIESDLATKEKERADLEAQRVKTAQEAERVKAESDAEIAALDKVEITKIAEKEATKAEIVGIKTGQEVLDKEKANGIAGQEALDKEKADIDGRFEQAKKLFQDNYKLSNNLANIASYKKKLDSKT